MATRLEQLTGEVLQQAFLYDSPDSFRAGVEQLAHALGAVDAPDAFLDAGSIDKKGPAGCPECMIPIDDADPDDAHCPWCGARQPEPLQELVWTELKAIEGAWPEALEG